MKKRAMKKWIPRGTPYCYKTIKTNEEGMPYRADYCRNLVFDHFEKITVKAPAEGGSKGTKEVVIKNPVYRCRYTGIKTSEDLCLYDDVKVCGISDYDEGWT